MGDDSVTVEEVDGLLCVGGNTYEHREQLKRLGLRWNAGRKVWTTPNRSDGMINSLKREIGSCLVVIHNDEEVSRKPPPQAETRRHQQQQPQQPRDKYRPESPFEKSTPSHILFATTNQKREQARPFHRNDPRNTDVAAAPKNPGKKAPPPRKRGVIAQSEGFRFRLEDSDEGDDDPVQKRNYGGKQMRRSFTPSPPPSPTSPLPRRAIYKTQRRPPPPLPLSRKVDREDSYEEVYMGQQTNIRLEVVSSNDDEMVSNFW